ncbi:hypothetical protein B5808_17825 [Cnuibacter physcomitrellae]|uniref:Uncharacterized protein n=2 Tax=Cnuibacter physcomitrellae TaxID=1619308 RepID=A0A1X9LNT5_9MICO|nr:hypothetical protein B5808_17825 [Cnuibacter physcomitrellae]
MERPTVSILPWVIGLVVAGLTVSAVASLALDPSAGDGAATLVAGFGVQMVAVAVVCVLLAHHSLAFRRTRFDFLWLLFGVLPIGSLLLAIPAILSDPVYFDATSPPGFWSTLALHAVLILVGALFGPLLWFFILMPVSQLVGGVVALARGEKPPVFRFVTPIVMLALAAFILLGAGALDLGAALPGRFAAPQIVLAMLGLPGSYVVASPLLLWVCRGILLALLVAFLGSWWARRREAHAG